MLANLSNKTNFFRLEKYLPIIIFVISLSGVVSPYFIYGGLPGDIGDARFNRYVLEHFYLVLSGKETSFVNAPFFYPWIKTISFSDTHWGTGIIYVLFRLMHFSPEKAYVWWFGVGFVLNYWAAFFVNRSLGLRTLGATIGAFLFTFSLPVLWQDGHTQLLYRFYVPFAFLALHAYLQQRDPRLIAAVFLAISLQLLVSLYIGVFLTYFLIAYYIVFQTFSRKNDQTTSLFSRPLSHWVVAFGFFAISFFFFMLFAIPYWKVQHLYGFHHSWSEIRKLLPHIQSYFMAENSRLWFSNVAAFADVPASWEQQLFIGIGAFIAFLYSLLSKDFLNDHLLSWRLIVTVGIIIAVTLVIGQLSLYYFLVFFPGISAVRAVCRVMLVLIFPISIIVGQVIDCINSKKFKWIRTKPIVFILCSIIVVDSMLASKHISYTKEWLARLKKVDSMIHVPVTKESILALSVSTQPNEEAIDAMIYAQLHGIKTFNGYSGNAPPGYKNIKTCQDLEEVIRAGEAFYREKLFSPLKIDRNKIIYVGFPTKC